jgi:hypothetical protein
MGQSIGAAAAVVLRDGDAAHPRDVTRNALKELVALGLWRCEPRVIKVTIRSWDERLVLLPWTAETVPDSRALQDVHRWVQKAPTFKVARGTEPPARTLAYTAERIGGRCQRDQIVHQLLDELTAAGYFELDLHRGLALRRQRRHGRTPAGDAALLGAPAPDRPAGGRFFTNSERRGFDGGFDRGFEAGYREAANTF